MECRHCGLASRGDFCCFGCRVAFDLAQPVAGAPGGGLLLRLGLGIFLAMNVSVFSWLAYSQEVFEVGAGGGYGLLASLFAWLAFFLTTVVVALLGVPMLEDALVAWRQGRSDARLLVTLGVFAAWGLSSWHTFRGTGSLYFDTAAMILVIVTLGGYLEAGAKERAAGASRQVLVDLPQRVRRSRGLGVEEVDRADLVVGDLVEVRAGEMVSADGVVVEGASHVDTSSFSGESRPVPVTVGDSILAGTLNLDGRLWFRAEEVDQGTVLAQMEDCLRSARALRPPIQRLADRVASLFVPLVTALALALLVLHTVRGDFDRGLLIALSVLLISCPCALGLAAPLASWQALRHAARRGILVDSPASLERAATLDRIFFDKTGTLTELRPALDQVAVAPRWTEDEALRTAAALEAASAHPIARALEAVARERGLRWPEAQNVQTRPGLGVEGEVAGRHLRLGGERWARAQGHDVVEGDDLAIYLMDEKSLLGRFSLQERARPGVRAMAQDLRSLGLDLEIVSGDRSSAVVRLGKEIGIPGQGDRRPDEKVMYLEAARADGSRVAMVGDGLNDGPVLAASDLGIAMGSATDLAKSSGHVRLLGDDVDRIPILIQIARDTHRRIRANLAFGFAFNGIGIGLAATGHLTPVFAALAMVVSSLWVVQISSGAGRLGQPGEDHPLERVALDLVESPT